MKKEELKRIAYSALEANPTIVARIEASGPQGQYKAVGTALAGSVARRAKATVNDATWAIINAYNEMAEANEEINDDF